jgi:Ca2+-binding RTX toxin-like protein
VSRSPLLILLVTTAVATSAGPAAGAGGDVFRRGTRFCASTYPGHDSLEQFGGFGAPTDLGGGDQEDHGWPVYAPGNGRVEIYSRGWGDGWGNSVIWTSSDGVERIHMAHLSAFGDTGRVGAGALIGRVGNTGRSTGPHLHVAVQRNGRPANRLVLGGRVIEPGRCYVSLGPIPVTCLGRPATLVGTGGSDRLIGTPGRDVIAGLGGDDRIEGRGGRDLLCGNGGRDRVLGGSRKDVLDGGSGADALVGGRGHDRLRGRTGADRMQGGRGSDRLTGGDGHDVLRGGPGGDRLRGGDGGDVLRGQGGPDSLDGARGADVLEGGPGADRLVGGTGFDLASYLRAAAGVVASLLEGTGPDGDVLAGLEALRGSLFDDVLTGDGLDNRLFGERGADLLQGEDGHDYAHCGDDEDIDVLVSVEEHEACTGTDLDGGG